MNTVKNVVFSVITVVLFFVLIEGVSRLIILPGSYDYIERRIIEQKLNKHKGKNEFRIFLFGESTMFGGSLYPYSTIDKWIKLYIDDLLPNERAREVSAHNFGRLGVSSRFVATAFKDLIAYKPDLAIFYTVHNDFIQVEHRRALLYPKSAAKKRKEFFETFPKKSAFLNLLNRIVIRSKMARNNPAEANARKLVQWYSEIDEGAALSADDANLLRPGSQEFSLVQKSFEANVGAIVDLAGRNNIPIILMEGVAKWRSYEPARSMHDASLNENALSIWRKFDSEAAVAFQRGSYDDALKLYSGALEIDPHYAATLYRIAQCYEELHMYEKAQEYYRIANDNDWFPIRAPSTVNEFYEKIRSPDKKGVYVIQTQKLFEDNATHGIIDGSMVLDQIHPTVEGQALIALTIVRLLYDNDFIAPKSAWRWDRVRSVSEMRKALEIDQNAELEIALGSAGYVKKDYPEAVEFLEQAIAIMPRSLFVRSWLAWAYWQAHEKEKALELYRQLYREAPVGAKEFFGRHPEIKEAIMAGNTR
jgi:hypothetical protein